MEKIKTLLIRLKNLILNHKKISIPLILILIVLVVILFPKGEKTILTDTVKKQDVVKTVSVTGKISSENIVNLTFQFGGKLIYLGAKEGDTVEKWQAIASLDKNVLEASFRQAQQDFTAARAASDQYYDGHKNATESYPEKVARTALDATQNKAYDQMMKVQQDLNNSTLYSPIDGILTSSGADTAGVNITALTVFTITDPTSLVFNMDVDETDVGSVRVNQKITTTLDAFPNDPVKLNVDSIDFVSHTTTSGGNAYTVKAKILDDKGYRVGMSGNAEIVVAQKDDVLAVPLSSVIDDEYVYVKVGNGFEKRKVKLGLQSDTLTQVLEGVSEGEVVAVDPSTVPPPSSKKFFGII